MGNFLEACEKGDKEKVEHLLAERNDPKANPDYGVTPVEWLKYGEDWHLSSVILFGDTQDEKNNNGNIPLCVACCYGQSEIVQLLLEKGADPNSKGGRDITPLYMACLRRHFEIARLLLEKGADPNPKIGEGTTPLHIVCRTGDFDFAEILLEKGADPNTKDIYGWTPFFTACSTDHSKIVQLLLDKGANKNAKTSDGRTPLCVACETNHFGSAQILIENGALLDNAVLRLLVDSKQPNIFMINKCFDAGVRPKSGIELDYFRKYEKSEIKMNDIIKYVKQLEERLKDVEQLLYDHFDYKPNGMKYDTVVQNFNEKISAQNTPPLSSKNE